MGKARHPHRGSMQFWPRKRSRHSVARIRSWAAESKVKPLGFIGYKAGMAHVLAVDGRAKSVTKGETLSLPTTIVECPPMIVYGVVFYKKTMDGLKKTATILHQKFDKHLSRIQKLPKQQKSSFDTVAEYDDLRLLVHSQPALTGIGTKAPKTLEIALGGNKDDKLTYAKDILGKTLSVNDVFATGGAVDIHGVTKGKGFQGTVKRYGIPIRQHKSEKTKRGIGNLGSWTPKRVQFTVAQPGKMGYHQRTEYNKHILALGENGADVTPPSGITKYGVVRNPYVLIKGSLVGPRKRAVVLTQTRRPTKDTKKEAFTLKAVVR